MTEKTATPVKAAIAGCLPIILIGCVALACLAVPYTFILRELSIITESAELGRNYPPYTRIGIVWIFVAFCSLLGTLLCKKKKGGQSPSTYHGKALRFGSALTVGAFFAAVSLLFVNPTVLSPFPIDKSGINTLMAASMGFAFFTGVILSYLTNPVNQILGAFPDNLENFLGGDNSINGNVDNDDLFKKRIEDMINKAPIDLSLIHI